VFGLAHSRELSRLFLVSIIVTVVWSTSIKSIWRLILTIRLIGGTRPAAEKVIAALLSYALIVTFGEWDDNVGEVKTVETMNN
jgi:hypothetical protein